MLQPTMNTVSLAAFLLVGIASTCLAQAEAGAAEGVAVRDMARPGLLAVETIDLELKRAQEGAAGALLVRVHFPKAGGPYPVVLFSHGFGGNRESFAPIGQHWASHGCVVIHPSHADGLGRQAMGAGGEEQDAPSGRGRRGGLLGSLNDPARISGRVGDLVLVLDSLGELPKLAPGLVDKVDAKAIAVAGHSFGAYTAMLLGGVTVDLGKEKAKSFRDERVHCVVAISGQGTGQQGLTRTSWDALQLPMMTLTGTRDRGAGGQDVEWKKEPFTFAPEGDKYLVVIEGANHVSFGGALGPRGSTITDIVKRSTTHFLEAHLKGSEQAKAYLQSDRLVTDAAGKCTLERK